MKISHRCQRRKCFTRLRAATKCVITDIPLKKQVRDWLQCNAGSDSEMVTSASLLRKLLDAFGTDHKLPKELVMQLLDISIHNHRPLTNVLPVRRLKLPSLHNICSQSKTAIQYYGSITVVGDVHGQFDDFAVIFKNGTIGGNPSEHNQLIFNGDLVDRGPKSVEILLVLLIAKMECQTAVHLLRGNHETRDLTERYGFKTEVLQKYDESVYEKFLELFNTLPIAAVVDDRVFVVHGGLGYLTANATIEDINREDRFHGPSKMLYEMMWAGSKFILNIDVQHRILLTSCRILTEHLLDPHESDMGLSNTTTRGTVFGADITKAFLLKNQLQCLVRSHEIRMGGYDVMHDGKCITVFSAPNYCGRMENLGAVVRYDKPNNVQPVMVTYRAGDWKSSYLY